MGSLRALLIVFSLAMVMEQWVAHASFASDFKFFWGANRSKTLGPDDLQLLLDKSGGSGIASKKSYLYGSIELRIKLVPGNSAGTVTTFYLHSNGVEEDHDEIDFEFLGNLTGQPYTIHTNIYTKGFGQREQQFKAWFDPTADYHNYTIHWNPSQIVWFIDSKPIRVFRNYHDDKINYPESQPMGSFASLWNGDQWATQGGRIKTNWTLAPFVASFQRYRARTCEWKGTDSLTKCKLNTAANWWTNPTYSKLTPSQVAQMKNIRTTSMIYNYCTDFKRFNGTFPKECSLPQF